MDARKLLIPLGVLAGIYILRERVASAYQPSSVEVGQQVWQQEATTGVDAPGASSGASSGAESSTPVEPAPEPVGGCPGYEQPRTKCFDVCVDGYVCEYEVYKETVSYVDGRIVVGDPVFVRSGRVTGRTKICQELGPCEDAMVKWRVVAEAKPPQPEPPVTTPVEPPAEPGPEPEPSPEPQPQPHSEPEPPSEPNDPCRWFAGKTVTVRTTKEVPCDYPGAYRVVQLHHPTENSILQLVLPRDQAEYSRLKAQGWYEVQSWCQADITEVRDCYEICKTYGYSVASSVCR